MKFLTFILGLFLLSNYAPGQDFPKSKEGSGFKSVFQKLDSGNFKGTANGSVTIQNKNNEEIKLNFEGSEAILTIETDRNEIYDVSTKIYKSKSASSKTEIEYRTYALANSFAIMIKDIWFVLSFIDGACMKVIDGIAYEYKADPSSEYLTLHFTSEFTLSNYSYLVKNESDMNPDKVNKLRKMEEKIKIMPGSFLVFAIKRKL